MIVINAVALLTVVWRIARREFSRSEWTLLAVWGLTYLGMSLQLVVDSHKFLPELRYWSQSSVWALGWAAIGLRAFSSAVAKRFAPAKFFPFVFVVIYAAMDLIMLVKSHIPFSRRREKVAACEWAVRRIAEDFHGERRDSDNLFSIREYHLPFRPVVKAHTARIPYLLGGRNEAMRVFRTEDLPDYIVDESSALKGLRWPVPYDLIGEQTFGRRRYVLYRRRTSGVDR